MKQPSIALPFSGALIMFGSLSGEATGALIIFNDRTSWEAAVVGPSIVTEDFNTFVVDTDSSVASFANFTLSDPDVIVDALDPSYESNPGTADIDGTTRLNFNGIGSTTFSLSAGVSAVAFDTANYDVDDDTLQVSVNGGSTLAAFPDLRGEVGFIGIVETSGTISTIEFTTDGDPDDNFNALDNFSTAAVPEPSGALLASLGLGLLGIRRKR